MHSLSKYNTCETCCPTAIMFHICTCCLSLIAHAFQSAFHSHALPFINFSAAKSLQTTQVAFAFSLPIIDSIPAATSLLTLYPNPKPLHFVPLTPLLPFITMKFPFTSASCPFPLAGNPSSTVHSHTHRQDQIMMDAGDALDSSDFGKIRCSSGRCDTLTQVLCKCMLVILLSVYCF